MTEMHPLREAAERAVSGAKGAFLRASRERALYVSDAPRRDESAVDAVLVALQREKLAVDQQNGLLFITPCADWVERLDRWIVPRVWADEQIRLLGRLSTQEASKEVFLLWLEAVRLIDGRGGAAEYEMLDKKLRQAAAVCLRARSGGAYLAAARRLWLYGAGKEGIDAK